MSAISVSRSDVRLVPDSRRVIARLFMPGDQVFPDGCSRLELIVGRILALPGDELASTLAAAYRSFGDRHLDLRGTLEGNFGVVAGRARVPVELGPEWRQLIGAYFTHEYAVESAALGNPSLVAAPDQSGLEPGAQRFIMSLRAVGEGHVSSIEFRSGVIDASLNVTIDEPSRYLTPGRRRAPVYDKRVFSAKLTELDVVSEIAALILDPLPAQFSCEQLDAAVLELDRQGVSRSLSRRTVKTVRGLAASNYELVFAE